VENILFPEREPQSPGYANTLANVRKCSEVFITCQLLTIPTTINSFFSSFF
jgi:hypothetical protein